MLLALGLSMGYALSLTSSPMAERAHESQWTYATVLLAG